jgi:hypothetical protein
MTPVASPALSQPSNTTKSCLQNGGESSLPLGMTGNRCQHAVWLPCLAPDWLWSAPFSSPIVVQLALAAIQRR